jgi:hypothetical protein
VNEISVDLYDHINLYSSWDKMNHTWELTEKLRTLMVQINYTQNGQVLFKTTTFLGYELANINPLNSLSVFS